MDDALIDGVGQRAVRKNEIALHLLAELDSRAREMTLEQWTPELIFEIKARRLRLLRGKAGRSEAEKSLAARDGVFACRAYRSGSRSRCGAVRIIDASTAPYYLHLLSSAYLKAITSSGDLWTI